MPEIPGELGYHKLKTAKIDASSSGNNTLITGEVGKQIRVHQIFIVLGGDVDIKFLSSTTELTPAMNMLQYGSFVLDYSGFPWFEVARDENFILNLSAAVAAGGRVYYSLV